MKNSETVHFRCQNCLTDAVGGVAAAAAVVLTAFVAAFAIAEA